MTNAAGLLVGAWLSEVQRYDLVTYDVRSTAGDAGSPAEPPADVVAADFSRQRLYVGRSRLPSIAVPTMSDLLDDLRASASVGGQGHISHEATTYGLWVPNLESKTIDRRDELARAVDGDLDLVVGLEYRRRIDDLVDVLAVAPAESTNVAARLLRVLASVGALSTRSVRYDTRRVAEVAQAVAARAEIGELTWAQVQAYHRTQRGIHAPRGRLEASIICNTGPHAPYPDRFLSDDVLRYVGRGIEGDQSLDGDNESLRLAVREGRTIRVFEAIASNRYVDHGDWIGVGDPDWVLEPGTGRRLVVFVLNRVI